MALSYLALLGRIILLGFERVFVKRLGEGRGSVETTFVFFGLAALYLLPVAAVFGPPSPAFLRYAVPSGVIYSLAFVFYVKSLTTGEVSVVSPLVNLNSLFLLALAAAFRGERFTPLKLAGTLAIIVGAALLQAPGEPRRRGGRNGRGGGRDSRGGRSGGGRDSRGGRSGGGRGFIALIHYPPALAMAAYAALLAVTRIIDRGGIGVVSPATYALTIYSIIALCLGVYLAVRGRLGKAWALFVDRPVLALLAGVVNAYSYLLLMYAFVGLPLSVAEPVSSLSLFVTAYLGAVMFGEKVRGRLVPSALVVLGSWLLLVRG
ncbi:MAG: EamA family transporter [Bacillota bacterium]